MGNNQNARACPCGSGKNYAQCCQPFHQDDKKPTTPEALMRSRYSAYAQANISYIEETMRGKALTGFDSTDAHAWASSVAWLGLRVIRSFLSKTPDVGYVEFVARFQKDNQICFIHELSEFHLVDGCWYYVDGKQQPTPTRNSLCPCGSGQKFKRCCGGD
jgi:SEC-C motif domain protein